jgi:hypothetical protein
MHGQKVDFAELFESGNGHFAAHPGVFGVAAEDIQCRCAVGTRIKKLSVPAGLSIQVS